MAVLKFTDIQQQRVKQLIKALETVAMTQVRPRMTVMVAVSPRPAFDQLKAVVNVIGKASFAATAEKPIIVYNKPIKTPDGTIGYTARVVYCEDKGQYISVTIMSSEAVGGGLSVCTASIYPTKE